MKNTGYDHHGTLIEKRASGYQKTPDGYVNAPYLDMSLPYAAGAMYSTVEDLYLWDQALYTDRVLSAATKELMYKPNLDDSCLSGCYSMIPDVAVRFIECPLLP